MRDLKVSRLQLLVHIGALLPLIWLGAAYLTNNLTYNPIQAATQRSGDFALIFLLLSLSCTPIYELTGKRLISRLRRQLGLYAFLYAALHGYIFVFVDYGLDWLLLGMIVLEKPFVIVGLAAFFILLVLAISSFKWPMKMLGKLWGRLHQLVYAAGILVIVHYGWAARGDFMTLQGDIWKPLLSGVILGILLVVRIPPVRKAITGSRISGNYDNLSFG